MSAADGGSQSPARRSSGSGVLSGLAGVPIPGGEGVSAGGKMAQSTVILVDRLTESNYSTWAMRIEFFLKKEGLWRYINDPLSSPMGAEEAANEKTLAHIVLSVVDCDLVHIWGKDTVQKAWEALCDVYCRNSAGPVIALMRKLYRMQMPW